MSTEEIEHRDPPPSSRRYCLDDAVASKLAMDVDEPRHADELTTPSTPDRTDVVSPRQRTAKEDGHAECSEHAAGIAGGGTPRNVNPREQLGLEDSARVITFDSESLQPDNDAAADENHNDAAVSEALFEIAASFVEEIPEAVAQVMPSPLKLTLYGLYKQATIGVMPCGIPRPSFVFPRQQVMFDYWKACAPLSQSEARARYVDTIAVYIIVRRITNNLDNQIFCSLLGSDDSPPEFLDVVYNKKLERLPAIWKAAEKFAVAVDDVLEWGHRSDMSLSEWPELSGLYMQALCGDNLSEVHGLTLGLTNPAIWGVMSATEIDAWNSWRGTSRQDAMQEFVLEAHELTESPHPVLGLPQHHRQARPACHPLHILPTQCNPAHDTIFNYDSDDDDDAGGPGDSRCQILGEFLVPQCLRWGWPARRIRR